MPPSDLTLNVWLERHREKLIDAALLVLTVNLLDLVGVSGRIPWTAQLGLLALLAALALPRAYLTPGLWPRYLKLLPGYLGAAIAGVVMLLWWFGLSRDCAWFVPVWLAFTVIARLSVTTQLRRLAEYVRDRRLEVVGADVLWVTGFSWAAPQWLRQAGPSPAIVAILLLGWAAWHWWRGGHDPAQVRSYARGYAAVFGLALAWGLLWLPAAGLGPVIVFTGWLGLALLLTRLAVAKFAAAGDSGSGEVVRWIGLLGLITFLFHPFVSASSHGAGDARYYATFLADTLTQFRHGVFPVFVGQSEYQFNGAVIPIRVAPGFQYLAGLVDLLTGRTLGLMAVQNLLIFLTALGGAGSAYVCLRLAALPAPTAWMLALLLSLCPGVMGLPYISDLYMSWMTVPWVPVIFYLTHRSFTDRSARVMAALGFGLGVTWWLHAPIALWLSLVAAIFQLGRLLALRPGWPVAGRQIAAGAAAFFPVAAYPLVSSLLYPANPALGSGGGIFVPSANIVAQLVDTFPAAWLPLSSLGRLLSDFQLGYGLLAAGVVVLPAAWRSRRVDLRIALLLILALLLLLIPIPRCTLALWELVPHPVRIVTATWVMQRLYLVLAGCLVFVCAGVWSAARPAAWVHLLLIGACGWSTLEALKFIRGSRAGRDNGIVVADPLLPENTTLTRFSYGMLGERPAYFTHGVADPQLENRLLDAGLQTVVGGNQAAVIKLAGTAPRTDYVLFAKNDLLVAAQPMVLVPGRHYLVELATLVAPFPAATLVLRGPRVERVAGLPEYGEALSFGLGKQHPPFFPLWTSGRDAEAVKATIICADPAAAAALNGRVILKVVEYDPQLLPVRIHSWIPYTATVQTDQPGWLETPRMYQAGYTAQVDGRPAEVRRSPQGLASVPVPAGRAEVVLRYAAPAGLAGAFWISFGAIATGAAALLAAGVRVLTGRTAPAASPAASGR